MAGQVLLTVVTVGALLAGCGSDQARTQTSTSITQWTTALPSASTAKPRDMLQRHAQRYPTLTVSLLACDAPAPSDARCGEAIMAIRDVAVSTEQDIQKMDGQKYPEIAETVETLRGFADLLKELNCFGLSGKAPDQNQASLCATNARLVTVLWMKLRTDIDNAR